MAESRRRLILGFDQKVKFREWLIANHKYICDRNLSRAECVEEASKTLGFPVHVGHLPDVLRSIPDLKWPFSAITGPSAGVSQEEFDALKEAMQLMDIGITDINTKISQLQSQYSSLAEEIAELRMSIGGRLKSVEDRTTVTINQVNELIGTINRMNQTLNMAMTELGFVKLDKEFKKGLAAVASAINKK